MLDDKIFHLSVDNHLIAVDARSGSLVWETLENEVTAGIGHLGGPIAVRDKVISGRSCAAAAGGPEACFIAAHDAATGAEIWRTYTIPRPGEPGDEAQRSDEGHQRSEVRAADMRTGRHLPRPVLHQARDRVVGARAHELRVAQVSGADGQARGQRALASSVSSVARGALDSVELLASFQQRVGGGNRGWSTGPPTRFRLLGSSSPVQAANRAAVKSAGTVRRIECYVLRAAERRRCRPRMRLNETIQVCRKQPHSSRTAKAKRVVPDGIMTYCVSSSMYVMGAAQMGAPV